MYQPRYPVLHGLTSGLIHVDSFGLRRIKMHEQVDFVMSIIEREMYATLAASYVYNSDDIDTEVVMYDIDSVTDAMLEDIDYEQHR